ncbi:uncharacterized protein LOC131593431 [Vicia villosa]|uniref:uncharacterized protein LOC131593431 n=1 Tax=Vicia villosa TaxID=3911 RepID=UPI00273C5B70|nr:uncharacterized protein LOC131593431 [Vicia villosa]
MASGPKGAHNRAPVFNGENYGYWKDCMCVHINAIDRNIWTAIVNGPFQITMTNAAGAVVPKPENTWDAEDEKRYAYDWKARNILISALGVDEYYRVSHCRSAKAMWDTLQVAHEGTDDVKLARINTLTQEFELFHMEDGESIKNMQKRFVHLKNRLNSLDRPVSNAVATNKILRCLNREWQPKVTAIKEANDLNTLDITTLFGKLEEHEQHLKCLDMHEKRAKKEKNMEKEVEKKSIALKASSSKTLRQELEDSDTSDDEDSDDEEMELFVRRYHKYLKKNGAKHSDKGLINYRKQSNKFKQDDNNKGKIKGPCFNCGKVGHYKPNCPYLEKEKEKNQSKGHNKSRRAYIAWESDSSSEVSSSDEEELTNLCLTAHQHKKKKRVSHLKPELVDKVSHSQLKLAFEELHRDAIEAFKLLVSNKKIFSYLESKVEKTEKDMEALKQSMLDIQKDKVEIDPTSWFGCETCHIWQKEVRDLKAKLDKALQPKVTFAVDPNKFKRSYTPLYSKYTFVPKVSTSKTAYSHHITCHYCCKKGHTIEKCKFRRILVPKGVFQWLPKCNNLCTHHLGPNEDWGPSTLN